jgi:hypothetical protein
MEVLSKVVKNISRVIKKSSLLINYKTGFHVHLDFQPDNIGEIKRLLKFIRYYEPAIYSTLPPSREGEINPYCKFIRPIITQSHIDKMMTIEDFKIAIKTDCYDRRVNINFLNFVDDKRPTVEIRSHSGTMDHFKIINWISLWMMILKNGKKIDKPVVPDNILFPSAGPEGDLVMLSNEINLNDENVQYLKKRKDRFIRYHNAIDYKNVKLFDPMILKIGD